MVGPASAGELEEGLMVCGEGGRVRVGYLRAALAILDGLEPIVVWLVVGEVSGEVRLCRRGVNYLDARHPAVV
jgi:hypothetical protein